MRREVWATGLGLAAIVLGAAMPAQCAAAQAGQPLMRAAILPGLIAELAGQVTPITVEIPGADSSAPVTIAAVAYCGGDSRGGAGALAVIVPADSDSGSPALSTSDCDSALPGLAARLARGQSGAWLEVAKLHVTWRPWRLGFSVDDTATAGSGAPRLKHLAALGTIATAGLNLLPPPGQNYRFDLALGFTGSTIVAAVFPAVGDPNPAPYLSSGTWTETAPAPANLMAEARYSFINQMLRVYQPSYALPISTQGGGAVVIDQVAAAGGDNALTITGRLTYTSVSYRGAMMCQGPDLRINQITLQPPALDCAGGDMITQLRCQGQQAAMTASSSALGAGLTNFYQGRQFHYSTAGHPLRLRFAGEEFDADFAALRSSSTQTDLNEAGRATVRRVAP